MMTGDALREQRVVEAIEKAEGLGSCDYVGIERPSCVIAQLYTLEGGSLAELECWEGHMVSAVIDQFKPELLLAYNRDLLEDLQYLWDCPDSNETKDAVKHRMKVRTREYFDPILRGE